MPESKNIQLSYCLLHLTKDDLDVINSILKCMPGLDLNHFGLSLLFLGHLFCTDKQKIFLNGPLNNEFEDKFKNPIRLRFTKDLNVKLFNTIKRTSQGKLRRNYLTAVIHTGISTFIELVCLFKSYRTLNDISSLYSLNTFALKFGLDSCIEKYSDEFADIYEFDSQYLINKYKKYLLSEISIQKKPKNSSKHETQKDKVIVNEPIQNISDVNNQTEINQEVEIDTCKNYINTTQSITAATTSANTIVQEVQEVQEVQKVQDEIILTTIEPLKQIDAEVPELTDLNNTKKDEENDWLQMAFNPKLL
ncbi:hypothetical protein [Acinetobacter sp. YH01009]|uniref:hypothetical protein n=1 Tax=Acinetobacter sp. YH01009 TaxID=2601025 RepID=UPI0015D25C90|nr:hypothetical protein [Acinetobacter sp. YH01009]